MGKDVCFLRMSSCVKSSGSFLKIQSRLRDLELVVLFSVYWAMYSFLWKIEIRFSNLGTTAHALSMNVLDMVILVKGNYDGG